MRYIVGIDEVGRGPLAGPVTVGFMACPMRLSPRVFANIRDSKKLSPKKREEWLLKFKGDSRLYFGTASASSNIIDKKGISFAIKTCVNRCLARFSPKTCNLFLDGGIYAPSGFRQRTIIKGDEKVPVIAAASIVAKVTRDKAMVRLAKKFPNYGFELHKGYGTRYHSEQIKINGLSAIHRQSFCHKFAPRLQGPVPHNINKSY